MNGRRLKSWVTLLLAIGILVPSMFGFANKFQEFLLVFRNDPAGVFAITPIVNYLLASLGFLMMLFWATANGMFHDLERPKHAFLEQEQELDKLE
jgi:nitrogen fixation-related uncharacterized protein